MPNDLARTRQVQLQPGLQRPRRALNRTRCLARLLIKLARNRIRFTSDRKSRAVSSPSCGPSGEIPGASGVDSIGVVEQALVARMRTSKQVGHRIGASDRRPGHQLDTTRSTTTCDFSRVNSYIRWPAK